MDIAERKLEIQFMVAENNISQAIKRSMDFVKDFGNHRDLLNEIIVISGNYHRVDSQSRRGIMTAQELDPQLNKLLYQLLALLDQIEDGFFLQSQAAA